MYTVSPEVIARFHNDSLYLTSIFVLVGLLRYIQVTVVDKRSGNPTKVILKDHFIQLVVLAWLVAFTFLHYALANIQNITGSQVFTIFKYVYNIAVLVLLGYVAVYVLGESYYDQLLAFKPFLVFAVTIAWIVINFKLRAATGCGLFAVYAAILIASIGANILYGMLQVLAPVLITAEVVKYMALANLILKPFY